MRHVVWAAVLAACAAGLADPAPARERDPLDDALSAARAARSRGEREVARSLYEWLAARLAGSPRRRAEVLYELSGCYPETPTGRRRATEVLRLLQAAGLEGYEDPVVWARLRRVAGWGRSWCPTEARPGEPLVVGRDGGPAARYALFRWTGPVHPVHVRALRDAARDLAAGAEGGWRKSGEAAVPADASGDLTLPLVPARPGVYAVVERVAGLHAVHLVRVPTLDVAVRALDGRVAVFAVDPWTGAGLPDVAVEVEAEAEPGRVARGRTDGDGLVVFEELPTPAGGAVVVRRGAEAWRVEWLPPALHRPDPPSPHLVEVSTDRPLYRGGEVVRYKAVHRVEVDRGLALPAREPVRVELRGPWGDVLAVDERRWSERGTLDGAFELAPDALPGGYAVVVATPRDVGRFDPWYLNWDREPPPAWLAPFTVAPSEERSLAVEVTVHEVSEGEVEVVVDVARGGLPLRGADVAWYVDALGPVPVEEEWLAEDDPADLRPASDDPDAWVYGARLARPPRRREEVASGSGVTDRAGRLRARVSVDDGAELRVRARAAAEGGVEALGLGRIRLSGGGPAVVEAGWDRAFCQPGDVVEARVRVRRPDGRPLPRRPVRVVASLAPGPHGAAPWGVVHDALLATDAAGRLRLPLPVLAAGRVRVEAAFRDDDGTRCEARAELWSVGPGVLWESFHLEPDGAFVELVPERVVHTPGAVARFVARVARPPVDALLTVEGRALHEARVVHLREDGQLLEVPLPAAGSPSLEVRLQVFRQGRRLDDGVEVFVRPAPAPLEVTVRPPARARPGAPACLRITTRREGRPVAAEVELAVVDAARLEAAPPARPWRPFFFPPREVGAAPVRRGHAVDTRRVGDGGGWRPAREEPVESGPLPRAEGPVTLLYAPRLETGADGTAEVRLALPSRDAEWRVTARGVHGADGFGEARAVFRVRREVAVDLRAPEWLSVGDVAVIEAAVASRDRGGSLTARLALEGLELVGPGERQVVTVDGQARVAWTVRAVQPGPAAVRVSAAGRSGAGEAAADVSVRPPGGETFSAVAGVGAASWVGGVEAPSGAAPRGLGLALEVWVARDPLEALLQALSALEAPDGGSVEELASRVVATDAALRACARAGLARPDLERALAARLDGALAGLARLQDGEGGWGWWGEPGDRFTTAWAAVALAVARERGRPVDPALVEAGARWLGVSAPGDPFALYARWRLDPERVAYEVAGFDPEGCDAEGLAWLVLAGRADLARRLPAEPPLRTGFRGTLSGALVLQALARAGRGEEVERFTRWLLERRRGGGWPTTLETAWAVAALAELVAGPVATRPAPRLRVDGRRVAVGRSGRAAVGDLDPGPHDLEVEAESGWCAVSAVLRGAPEPAKAAGDAGLVLRRRIEVARAPEDRAEPSWRALGADEALLPGGLARLVVEVEVAREVEHLLLEVPLPGGVRADRGEGEPSLRRRIPSFSDDPPEWLRLAATGADRLLLAARRLEPGTWSADFPLHATRPGSFAFPGAEARCLYDVEPLARTAPDRVRVAGDSRRGF